MEERFCIHAYVVCLPVLVVPKCIYASAALPVCGIFLLAECFCSSKPERACASSDVSWGLLSRLCMQLWGLIHTADKTQKHSWRQRKEVKVGGDLYLQKLIGKHSQFAERFCSLSLTPFFFYRCTHVLLDTHSSFCAHSSWLEYLNTGPYVGVYFWRVWESETAWGCTWDGVWENEFFDGCVCVIACEGMPLYCTYETKRKKERRKQEAQGPVFRKHWQVDRSAETHRNKQIETANVRERETKKGKEMEEKVDRTETKACRRIEFAHSVILQRPKCTCKVFLRYLAVIRCNSPFGVVCQHTLISVFLSEKLAQSVTENSQREKRVQRERVSNKEAAKGPRRREKTRRRGEDGKTECLCGFVECKSKGALSREEKLLWCNVVCSASAQYLRSFWWISDEISLWLCPQSEMSFKTYYHP